MGSNVAIMRIYQLLKGYLNVYRKVFFSKLMSILC